MVKTSTREHVLRGVRVAVFDLDCTLFDSRYVWDKIDDEFLHRRGKEPTAEYKRKIVTLGSLETARFTIKYYGLDETPEELEREWLDMALHEYENLVPLFAGVEEYLKAVHADGIKIVAATSVARELAVPCLKRNGIFDMFDAVFTSNEIGLKKSSPEFYGYILSSLGGAPNEYVVFDDAVRALRAAKNVGMRTVAIRTDGGFSDGLRAGHKTADYIADGLIKAPKLMRNA